MKPLLFALLLLPLGVPLESLHEVRWTVGCMDSRGTPLVDIEVLGENFCGYPQPRGGLTDKDGKFTFTWHARFAQPLGNPPRYSPGGPRLNESDRLFGGPSVVTFIDRSGKHQGAQATRQFVWLDGPRVKMFDEKLEPGTSKYVSWLKLQNK